ERSAIHEARRARRDLPDVALRRPGVGASAPRGLEPVSRGLRRLGLMLALVGGATSVWAHGGGTTGYASITISRSTVRYSLTLPTATLTPDLADALRLAQRGSAASRETLLGLIRSHVTLRANDVRCEPGPGEVTASTPEAPSFTMLVDF